MAGTTLTVSPTMAKRRIFDRQTPVKTSFEDWVRTQCGYCRWQNYRNAGADTEVVLCPCPSANLHDPDELTRVIVYDLERGEELPDCIMQKIEAANIHGLPMGVASDEPHYV